MKIDGIPTDTFYRMIADLGAEQWKIVSEYTGFDKGIDYDAVVLKKKGIKLRFVWVQHLDGSLEGLNAVLLELRERYRLG
jgi:hypothetical protein